jgi:hypothetical protein
MAWQGFALGKSMNTLRTAAFAAGILVLSTAAEAGTLIPVAAFPDSTSTVAYGINDSNAIVGYYTRSDGSKHGFTGPLNGVYSSFDFGAGGETIGFSLSNEGWITGLDNNPTEECPVFGCEYVRQPTGEPDKILRNGAGLDGITGQIVAKQKFIAEYWSLDQNQHLVTTGYYGMGAAYVKDLNLPIASTRVRARGYNKKHEVVGYYLDSANQDYPAFILLNGVETSVNFPAAFLTEFVGLNDKGVIVGGWQDQTGSTGQAFIYDAASSAFKIIKVPGSSFAIARQINNSDLVTIVSDVGSYVYCAKKRTCPAMPGVIEIKEQWVPALRVRNVPCRNGCTAPHQPRGTLPVSPEQLRERMQQDKDLRLQLTSPYLR